ncbi:membrane protein [Marinicauda pacifica]|uniref:Protein MgtC n=1 Tax=Marinicauda pacifica TaxID=1133559 RepID=A0A4S2HDL3_9PROT|nr:MgtC/SapB family protein [Marinicauda pacifica]TGY93851.1 MgtC/SapB family protein [Marinicauda pacifica]GGE30852.1 membrane protein [Marinicauda pacifica]
MFEAIFQTGPAESYPVAAFRLFLAAIAGAFIGLEREDPERNAGLRTNMLVSLAACLFTLTALGMTVMITGEQDGSRPDPIRVIEAVTSGVAFIAAGSIIRSGADVRGVTTAAALWLAGAIGVSIGVGHILLPGTAIVIALLVLVGLRRLEHSVFETKEDKGPKSLDDKDDEDAN